MLNFQFLKYSVLLKTNKLFRSSQLVCDLEFFAETKVNVFTFRFIHIYSYCTYPYICICVCNLWAKFSGFRLLVAWFSQKKISLQLAQYKRNSYFNCDSGKTTYYSVFIMALALCVKDLAVWSAAVWSGGQSAEGGGQLSGFWKCGLLSRYSCAAPSLPLPLVWAAAWHPLTGHL